MNDLLLFTFNTLFFLFNIKKILGPRNAFRISSSFLLRTKQHVKGPSDFLTYFITKKQKGEFLYSDTLAHPIESN